MKESDLYAPLKHYLEKQGFEVKGEIHDCDVVAMRGDEEPLIVELKLRLNLDLLLQSVDRLKLSGTVYIGIPGTLAVLKKQKKRIIKLVRLLGVGLIAIYPERRSRKIDVLVDPGPYEPRQSGYHKRLLLREFTHRVGDPTAGGSDTRAGRMTAYRQQAIALASHLRQHGPTKAADIAKALDQPRARDILYRNVYGWFERLGAGIYQLSARGEQELSSWIPGHEDTALGTGPE